MQFAPHWQIGFAFMLGVGAIVVGFILMFVVDAVLQAVLQRRRPSTATRRSSWPTTRRSPPGLTLPDSCSQEATVVAPDFSNLPSGRTAIDPETGETYRAP